MKSICSKAGATATLVVCYDVWNKLQFLSVGRFCFKRRIQSLIFIFLQIDFQIGLSEDLRRKGLSYLDPRFYKIEILQIIVTVQNLFAIVYLVHLFVVKYFCIIFIIWAYCVEMQAEYSPIGCWHCHIIGTLHTSAFGTATLSVEYTLL